MLDIEQHLFDTLRPWRDSPSLCVAFSGGMDSSVLLYALAQLAKRYALPQIRAVYIHHGLQDTAESWPAHCQRFCDELQIPLTVLAVHVASTASVEQAAREARYAAFSQHLLDGEVLLMAQHQDDQAETFLFRLLRGAGVAGLRGIPDVRSLSPGVVVRPLLNVSRQALLSYAQRAQLSWIEDPSNDTDAFDRNYLRRQVIPVLKKRWPAMLGNLQRTVGHMHEAQDLLNELAMEDLQHVSSEPVLSWLTVPCLDLDKVRQLSFARQKNVLRYWLAPFTLLPDSAHWAGWENLRDAREDAQPIWRLHNGVLQCSQNRLYYLSREWLQAPPELELIISCAGRYSLPGNGYIEVKGGLTQPLRVGYRQGTERFQLLGRGSRDLKRLLQEYRVPHFVRSRLPIFYAGQQPVALANEPKLNHHDLVGVTLTWCFSAT
ncbi:tRNA lysidine(34) synthetase TilS [Denitrificimonas sp. JX-1]|uniref:tRNA(Ile)-lysidine synthase n=1 Tax=Denitrificimonas halotolerans TaxID=3098930 RepID=A0ABU5GPT7_9GAMM|nr:tRNA lysidine(34) synthetase TilS [Denitrificimonas sp. JX-1]MDY7219007.1 tRNA lysidine(34) synthetase TilS [Denitrificimonas sp. JX-1]